MNKTRHFLSIGLMLIYFSVNGQQQRTISGKIIDLKTNEPLGFANVSLKRNTLGTISNENGEFDFLISAEIKKDSLVVSYMGYKSQFFPLEGIKAPLVIRLEAQNVALTEVVVRPQPRTYYIKLAMQSIGSNYPNKAFETQAYYRNRIWENKVFIKDAEAVVKSYYPNYQSKSKNEHQILLHRKGNTQGLKFMAEKIVKEEAKEKKKALKRGEAYEETDIETMLDLGGPETVLGLNFIRKKEYFLDSLEFNKYTYSFGKPVFFNGKELMVINFENKKVVGHQRQLGHIFMDPHTNAIVSIDYKSDIVIPILAQPVIFVMGYDIDHPTIQKKYSYQELNGRWYPQNVQITADVKLTKKHFFKSNEVSSFQVENLFMVNKINTEKVNPIPESKKFNPDKKLEEQVFTESGITWDIVNVVKR